MIRLFDFKQRRKRRALRELAPQWTAWQRRALEPAGIPPAGLPYSTYDDMERDAMVQTCLTVKKLGVVATEWRIVSDVGERADFVREAFERMEGSPLTILNGAMDAFAKGWSVQEVVYSASGSVPLPTGQTEILQGRREAVPRIWIEAVRPKDPSLFGMEVDRFGKLRELRLQLPGEPAIEVPRAKFVVYGNRGSYGRPKGRSDLDAAYRHWSAKQALLNAWRFHLERFAMPTLLGSFQRGLSAEEQAAILSAMQNLSQHTAVIFPNEIEIDTLGGQKESSAGFMEAIDFHNREIARSILGQTLTTDEGRRVGSLAMGKVHLQVLLLQLDAIRRELADLVMTEQVVRPLVELNFGPGPIPRFEFAALPASAFATGDITR